MARTSDGRRRGPSGAALRRHAPRVAPTAALLGLAVALGACGAVAGGGGGPPEPAAEGITLYSGRIPSAVGGAIDMYEAKVNRDVQVRFGDSSELTATLIEEGENSPADAFFAQETAALSALSDRGLLAKLPPDIVNRVPPEFRAEDGTWVGTTGRARVVAYHEDLDRSELPDSPLEFTAPKWRGRVGWAPVSGSLQDYVTALRLKFGDAAARRWLEGMQANGVKDYPNNVAIRDAIAAGEIDVGLINHYYVARAQATEGPDYPVKLYFPPEGLGSLVLATGVGVPAASENKEQAFDFVRAMLSRPAQRFFTSSSKEYPLAKDVEPPPSVNVPLEDIPVPEGDLSSITERQETIELMQEAGAL